MSRHDWEENVIHLESCKKLKIDYANKWCIHNTKYILENETHKFLLAFEVQVKQVKLTTVVKGDPKASFLIATTPRCRSY